ncbi:MULTISPECIES: methylated-DNA--[protein]-cysteine S-methyltransferase [Flavobacterium]|uniref:Methylated-DNA--protein-cysteine methyltransferase n=2 Tax=Flavobacterium TaxID=237 RepID=A0A437UBY5_9FLAO|nr:MULTISPECIES: methylated-DNA--[protein]-cysteine S-methyltransferase [Flavobacterium]OWP84143.1 cysteine methyltransferase [Flavobacterium davisii]QYS89978.1 methylated-DNA--[protein]-cysteine S-methyltransferase [Flavobacterium davisii]RVU91132.1 methylated-DNA--[protein]-cysteine S-methyltransferase [Flavobacterium columnare]SPE77215.1 Methylated-DNA--protein-cysteine methyltransferase [Flavobacterium columnare]
MKTAFIHSPLGITKITGDQEGIVGISIITETYLSEQIPEELLEAVNQLQEYFKGNRTSFSFTLNLKGTDFQKKVWHELRQIPFGKTISYLDLAKKLGNVKAIRAVASANAKNPIWIVVPCHRVIGTDGSLTGYAGGLWRKKWLLDHENSLKQQTLF